MTAQYWDRAASQSATLDILFVEDSHMDVRWTLRALGDSVNVCHVRSGHQAMKAFDRARPEREHRPQLVILDLTVPAPDGFALLAALREDSILGTIPIIMFTQSKDPTDIRHAYEGGVNCYVWKPRDREPFERTVEQIRDFWLQTVSLPQFDG